MPNGTDYVNFFLINLGFIFLISIIYYWVMLKNIQTNWALYRCNPVFMPFADNIQENFVYCIQNVQGNYMSYLLQPLNYISSSLISLSGDFNLNINGVRNMMSVVRDFITNTIQSVFGVFLNLIIEMQKITISIKDLIGKILGIVAVILYILSGSVLTMESLWNGPTGQLVKKLGGGCFHPKTKIQLQKGNVVFIKDLKLGDVLKDGTIVDGIIKLNNRANEPFYKFKNKGETNEDIYVTGTHFVNYNNKFIQVKEYPEISSCKKDKTNKILYNLITNNHTIPIGNIQFWDWEDDEHYLQQ
jgi:hypothetical protein